MKVLVTGGAGYIGSHTCKALAAAGHAVIVYDNLSTGHRDFARWGIFEHGDIRDYTALCGCLRRHLPEGIIHFAASSFVGESVANPGKYFHNNIYGTLTLLAAMRDTHITFLVASGSCAVYGVPEILPITESCPTAPVSPYGASKLFTERMMADFETAHGLRWMSLRYFNAAGADPNGEIGERHSPETHLIPRVLMAATGALPAIQIFGDTYPTPDGTCIRDYVHVTDLARAHVHAMERLAAGMPGTAVNLGTGNGISVLEIIRSAGKHLNIDIPHTVAPPRPGDPPILVADGTYAKTLLGWEPALSDTETILTTAWQWHTKDTGTRSAAPR